MPKWLKISLIFLVTAGLIVQISPLIIMGISLISSKIEVYEDIASYKKYLAGSDNKWNKWDQDESIWPREIADSMKVLDYRMVYYNPWDAQYLGYLSAEYDPEAYKEEKARLKAYESTEYAGIYSVKKEQTHDLFAIHADPYHGFVYAFANGDNKIVYAEQIFCNYMLDLDYKKYIPKEYMLDGFDASSNNPYRKQMMNNK